MKKLLNLRALLMLLIMTLATNVWGEDAVYKTASFTKASFSKGVQNYTSSFSSTTNGFTVDLANFNNNNSGWDYVKTGNKSAASVGTITTNAAIDKAVTKVVVTIDAITAASVNSITLYSGTSASNCTTSEGTFSASQGAQTVTISSPAANKFYKISFDCKKGSSNGLVQVSKVEYYFSGNTDDVAVSGISIDQNNIELKVGRKATLTATVKPSDASNTNVSWSSDHENIATVVDGVVTAVAEGNATITATTEDGNYTATCYVTVIPFVQTYANTYTSGDNLLTSNGGTSTSDAKVKWEDAEYSAVKAGTGNVAGAIKVTVPAGTKTLHMHIAGWNNEGKEVTVSGLSSGNQKITINGDSGVSGNSPFTLSSDPETNHYYVIETNNEEELTITITATSGNRFVLFGVNAEAGNIPTRTLSSIAVKTAPTKVTYEEGDKFDPAGLVITASYSDETSEDVAYADHASAFTFNPTLTTALTTTNTSVTITYGGKTATQNITVNAHQYTISVKDGIDYGTVSVSPEKATAGTVITITANPEDGYEVEQYLVLAETGNEYIAVTENTFEMPASNVTVWATFKEKSAPKPTYTIAWSVNGTIVKSETLEEGATVTAPDDPEDMSGKTFTGWIETATVEGETPAYVTPTTATKDVTYYAVFATGSKVTQWKKVAASAVKNEGIYAIITTDGHAFNGTISSGHGQVTSTPFSFDANGIATTAPEGTCEITFAAVSGGYTMYNASNGYLYASAASSGKLAWHNTESSYWLYKSSNWLYNSNNAYLRDYQNSSIRTYGANNGSVIQFAMKVADTAYSDYCTTFADITLIGIETTGTPDEFWKGDDFNHNGITVTATWSDESETDVTALSEFSTPDMTTAGQKTVTVTYLNETCQYNIIVQTIANTEATAYTTSETIELIDAGKDLATKVYVKGTVSKVEKFNETYGSITYWLDDNAFEVYSGLNNNGEKFSSIDDVKVGAEVIVLGKIKKYNTTYEMDMNNHLVSYIAPEPVYTEQTLTFKAQNNDGYWATFSSSDVTFFSEDVVVSAVGVENDALYKFSNDEAFDEDIVEINGEDVIGYYVPANTGVLIYSVYETINYYTVTGVTPSDDVEAVNMLRPASAAMETDNSYKFYKLAYNDYTNKTGLGFWWGAADGGAFTCKTGTAYLAVPTSAGSAKGFSFSDAETDGINSINANINVNEPIYNIAGQRVNANAKGILIQNGKKYLNK